MLIYEYSAWGQVLYTNSADIPLSLNPLRYRGYVYDVETDLYYLQSRYYDPQMGRFVNGDVFPSTGQGYTGNNVYVYCGNSPVTRLDTGGYFWDIVFDVASLVVSVVDVVTDPGDLGAWAGLMLDVADVVIPCVGGLGETADAVNATRKTARKIDDAVDTVKTIDRTLDLVDGFGDLSRASDYGIQGYKALRKQLKGTGLQAHHIIEQRLVKHLGIDLDNMLSVAVTTTEHRAFTRAWRSYFKYGMDYTKLAKSDIWTCAHHVYRNYPELLSASRKILFD